MKVNVILHFPSEEEAAGWFLGASMYGLFSPSEGLRRSTAHDSHLFVTDVQDLSCSVEWIVHPSPAGYDPPAVQVDDQDLLSHAIEVIARLADNGVAIVAAIEALHQRVQYLEERQAVAV